MQLSMYAHNIAAIHDRVAARCRVFILHFFGYHPDGHNPDKRDKYLHEIIFCQKRAEYYF